MKRFESTPIINVWWQSGEKPYDKRTMSRYHDELMAMHLVCKPPVTSLKKKLGKQDFTLTGSECRYWIWEGADWRVFAGKTGISFEVRCGLNKKRALAAWRDFLKRIGLTDAAMHRAKRVFAR
jgi:hypothetical protein